MRRTCKDCGAPRTEGAFHKGQKTYCKQCATARAVAWQKANVLRKRKNALNYYYKHQEEQAEYRRAYRQRPEVRKRERAYKKAYCKAHPDTTRRLWRARWRQKHPDLVAESKRRRAKRRYARKRVAVVAASKSQLE